MYAKIKDGKVVRYPYSLQALKTDHPNVSFPRNPSAALLASYGVVTVAPAEKPAVSPDTELQEGLPEATAKGLRQVWTVRTLNANEQAARTQQIAQKQLAAYDAQLPPALEELITVLLDQKLLTFAALPPTLQQLLTDKETCRQQLTLLKKHSL